MNGAAMRSPTLACAEQANGAVKAQSSLLDSDRLGAWKELLAVLSMSTARK
jgi:hypothetical protein